MREISMEFINLNLLCKFVFETFELSFNRIANFNRSSIKSLLIIEILGKMKGNVITGV